MATRKKKKAGTIKVQYYRSAIGFAEHQKRVVKGFGFRKLNGVRELKDTPELRGMVAKVPHLVRIIQDQD